MKKILISLVSKEVFPAYYSISEFNPDIVYLIGTKETYSGMNRIKNVAQNERCEVKTNIVSAYDIEGCAKMCDQIHEKNGADCEYIYNLTLGTKLMAFGAMDSAQRHNAKMIYTTPAECIDISRLSRTPLSCKISFEEMFKLQGQILKEYEVYKYDEARTECAKGIKRFITKHPNAYKVIAREYRNHSLSNNFSNTRLHYSYHDGITRIEFDGEEVLYSDEEDITMMLFEGRWWEALVADATAKWADGKYEIWTGVKFEPKNKAIIPNRDESKDIKNEIDVLVNLGTTMLFIECKSGDITQDNISKLNTVRQTYGSYQSKAVIISLHKVRPELFEKAKENNIDIFQTNNGDLNDLSNRFNKLMNSLKA